MLPVTPAAWDPALERHRQTLKIEVNGHDMGRLHIDRSTETLEVIAIARDARLDARLMALSRRHRLAVTGLTIHALAEAIAGCAWPLIASFTDAHKSA